MSGKEIDRVGIIGRVAKREMRQKTAGERLGLSVRQVQRLVESYRQNGAAGLVSKKRGKVGNRVLPPELKREALDWIRKQYLDFGPTLACEKLREVHDIRIGVETLRQWMIEAEIWIPKNARARQIHQPRRRRPCRGELIQIDGSPHDWFEGRGPKCPLLVYIDDATSEIVLGTKRQIISFYLVFDQVIFLVHASLLHPLSLPLCHTSALLFHDFECRDHNGKNDEF